MHRVYCIACHLGQNWHIEEGNVGGVVCGFRCKLTACRKVGVWKWNWQQTECGMGGVDRCSAQTDVISLLEEVHFHK